MDKALEQYLNTVDRKLRPLPASERADIVREIKSAMQDMAADGLPTEGILGRLGRPDALARAYLSDLLDKPERGGWRRLLTILAFYSLAGLSGMFVIPVLGICGPVFMLCGAAVPLAGLIDLAAWYLLGIKVPYTVIQLGPYTPPVAVGFLCSLVAGALLFWLGRACWRLLVRYLRALGRTRAGLSV